MADITVPQVDFSILGNLGNTYQEAQSQSLASLGRKQASEALARGDKQAALAALVGGGDAKTLAALGQYQSNANSVYGTPIYYRKPDGSMGIASFDKSGQFKDIDMKGGVPLPGVQWLDTGTGFQAASKRDPGLIGGAIGGQTPQVQTTQLPPPQMPGQPAQPPGMAPAVPQRQGGYVSKDVAGEKRESVLGADQAKAIAGLPGIIAKAEESIKIIDQAVAHPGRATATGLSGQLDPRNYFAGTDAKNFQILAKQLEGKAFLEAFESLKGGGQITEIEGTKGTQAIARLDRAQSDSEYLSALRDLREVIGRGVARAKSNAVNIRTPAEAAAPARAPAAAGKPTTKTIGGKTYIQNPANGDWYQR